jgi:DNA polymerase elongation subunit (family B)
MFYYHNFANNILNPMLYKKQNNDLIEYYRFKLKYKDFNDETHINYKIKCINWFDVKINNYLSFNILKARNVENNETMFFQFIKYNYVIYTKEDINKNEQLKKLLYLSQFKTHLYDISSIYINNGEVCNVNHYERFYSFADYCLYIDNILQNINKTRNVDYIILQTNFTQNKAISSCENQFNNFIFFTNLNNINPSDAYELINIPVRKSKLKNNIYYVENHNIKDFFTHKIALNEYVDGYCLSFDLESEVSKELDIKSEKNVLTHCGIEYFNTLYYKNFDLHKELKDKNSFSFCLINIDFHFKNKLIQNNIKIDYEKLRNNNISQEIKQFIGKEKAELNKNPLNLIIPDNGFNVKIFKDIRDNHKKYIFMREKTMFIFFFSLLKHLDVDYILTFNGSGYDFPQIGRRYSYLCNKKIDQVFSLPSLYNMEQIYYSESDNQATNFNIKNLIIKAPYFSIDLFNYVKKFHDKLSSYSLKDISKNIFSCEAICIKKPVCNEYKLTFKPMKRFIEVLLTSNYCFINNKSCKIIDKSQLINNNINIYEIDIRKIEEYSIIIVSNEDLTDEYNKISVTVQLSKDDVEIASSKLYEFNTSYDIADYCIHDTVLCRHLFEYYMVRNNIDIFSNLYYMQQHRAILYRNTTNIQGALFNICYKEKKFFLKSNKFYLNTYGGGKVLEPKEKFNKEPVMVFDFESLYPSIMINYNISPDKLVLVLDIKDILEYELLKIDIEKRFNSDHYTIIHNINEINNIQNYIITIFSKIDSNFNPQAGLLSKMLIDLKALRQFYKQEMKNNINNKYQYENCNLIQNNIKVLMNSVYGVLGSTFSNISCKFTSQSITSKGASVLSFLETMLDNSTIENKKITLNNHENIYNPFIENYFNNQINYDIDINLSHKIILKVIYGDTDSIMIVPSNINKHPYLLHKPDYQERAIIITSYIGKKLNEFIKNNLIINNKLNLQFENIFINMILQTKKKYTGISCEPIENIDLYIKNSDFNIENSDFLIKNQLKFKNTNKGISTKRRDICDYQKKIIDNLYKKIYNIIIDSRFNDNILSEDNIAANLWAFLEKEIKLLLQKHKENKLKYCDFLISCAYTDNYKLDDNHINILVKNYNSKGKDIIAKGDRFNYIYLIDINKNLSYIDSKINNYKIIYDDDIDLTNKRLCFEIYIHKIILNIITILNNSNIIKKNLINNFKKFITNFNNTKF